MQTELENQMATLKLQLEQQLKEKGHTDKCDSEMVIDVRVTNLELQIAEMNHKIQEAERVIREVEQEKIGAQLEKV